MTKNTSPWPSRVIVYTDGASRGNPGPAAVGIHIVSKDDEIVHQYGEVLGETTNNVAEYTAVVRALELCRDHQVTELTLRSDSELLVRQLTGQYRVKAPNLIGLNQKCKEIIKVFKQVRFEHVRREQNKTADSLANQALDFG